MTLTIATLATALLLAGGTTEAGKPGANARPGAATARPTATSRRPAPTTVPNAKAKAPTKKAGKAGKRRIRRKRGLLKAGQGKLKGIKDVCHNNPDFNIGRGIYDITGPAAEAQMMGYANPEQETAGIHMRLWSRAFFLESPCNGRRVVLVTADLGMVFQSVKQGVVDRLEKLYGNTYSDANVLISATHTHQGPAGHSHYALYNATGFMNPAKQGFDSENYEVIVDGIVKSIQRAHGNVRPGRMRLSKGGISNASKNRSTAAYAKNKDRHKYKNNVDRGMTLLRMDSIQGGALGQINWFAVHPTNFSKHNKFITGYNKGIAAQRFERDHGTDYRSNDTFVAAFANANEGDVSPNLWGVPDVVHDAQRASTIGERQYQKAKSLFKAGATILGGVDYRHRYANFSNMTVGDAFTGAGTQKTCPAALGISFAAGSTEDGPAGEDVFGVTPREGMTFNGKNRAVFPGTPQSWMNTLQPCHAEKDVFMPIGMKNFLLNPYPWAPEVLPIQLVRVGQLAIAAVPFECTTMCGRRIRETVLSQLKFQGVSEVVIAGLSNAYAGYVTTREEYAAQHYEGASTQFGPWTLAALRSQFHLLGKKMWQRKPVDPGPTPRRLGNEQTEIPDGVVFDDTPVGKSFGDVKTQPAKSYNRGQQVSVRFWAGHPKNNYRTQKGFMKVERKVGGKWVTVARDWDEQTSYRWNRQGTANSLVTLRWTIPSNAATGTYRIKHYGNYKNGWTHDIHSYNGVTRTFTVK